MFKYTNGHHYYVHWFSRRYAQVYNINTERYSSTFHWKYYNIFMSGRLKLKWLISMILNLSLAPNITYWNSL
jgi:hypothetical protein